jgi:hypothetical protein
MTSSCRLSIFFIIADGRTDGLNKAFVYSCGQPMVTAISGRSSTQLIKFRFLQPMFPVAQIKAKSRLDACSIHRRHYWRPISSHSHKHRYDVDANAVLRAILFLVHAYNHAPHNEASVNDGPHYDGGPIIQSDSKKR